MYSIKIIILTNTLIKASNDKKDIKLQIRNQLKRNYQNWKRLSKKDKKSICKKALNEVKSNYD